MKQLFNGRFAPLTFAIGFLECPLASVADAYVRWKSQHSERVDSAPVEENDLQFALKQLVPLTIPPRRILFFSTESRWTAYFDNGAKGADALPPISFLALQLECRGLIATCVPHALETDTGDQKGTYGAVQFELFAPTQQAFMNYERSISVAYDGGKWRFDANGRVQRFEDIAQYSARRIVDRFTSEMLQRYCEAIGIRAFDEGFYTGPGQLVVIHEPLPRGSKEVTLQEAREQLALG